MAEFNELGLSPEVLDAVARLGYEMPTPVQEQAIPLVLEGRDLIAAAKTGTGKTAAFSLPALDGLGHAKGGQGPLMLVVTPTRELAQQIGEVCAAVAVSTHHRIATVVGGLSYEPQIQKLKHGTDVLIATPGRLVDLMDQGAARLGDVEVLVLDEPTAGLDPKERVRFRNLISALAQDKVVILSTHIVSDVEYIADEILIMRAGQIVASGTIEEILAQVSGVVWECVVTPREADVMSARMAVGNVRYDHAGMAIVRIVSDTAPHSSARLVEPTLEDVYLYIFQEGSVSQENRPHDSRNARRGGRRG